MSSLNGFDTLPSGSSPSISPFTLQTPDTDLEALQTLLNLSPLAPETWENTTSTKNFGISRAWLAAAKQTWQTSFSWHKHEARINSFPQFTIPLEDTKIHFAALFSKKKDATPVIFMHGWPGAFLEFLPMLELLRRKYTPETLPFHCVVPSLPGYGLSGGPPLDRDFVIDDAARLMHGVMMGLGFGERGYVAQGGDVGYFLARQMSFAYAECKALHVNLLLDPGVFQKADPADLSPAEQKQLERLSAWQATGTAYAMEHATRPSTIGLVLAASPLALLAWIGEKHVEWADTTLEMDTVLALATLWWLTGTAARGMWPYRHLTATELGAHSPLDEQKPLGYSAFRDVGVMPKGWSKWYPSMKFRRDHEKGGHFAALEEPEAFLKDVEEFVIDIVGPLQ